MKSFLNNKSLEWYANVFLRFSSPAVRFVFLTFLAKEYGLAFLGEFSLFQTSVVVLLYFLGFDFFNHTIRNLIQGTDLCSNSSVILNHFFFIGISYIGFVSIGIIAKLIGLNVDFFFFLMAISILDHLSQEFYRIFNSLKKVLIASTILYFRSALWIIIVFSFWLAGNKINIQMMFLLWMIFSFVSCLIGFYYIFSFFNFRNSHIDLKWLKAGLNVSLIFFVNTLSVKAMEYSNRYVIDYYLTKSDIGVFSFLQSIVMQLMMIVDTVFIVTLVPTIISFKNSLNRLLFFQHIKKTIFISSLGGIFLVIGGYFLLKFVGNPDIRSWFPLIFILIIGQIFYIASLIPHTYLYAMHKDKLILKISIVVFLLGVLLTIVMTKFYGLWGTAISFFLTGFVIFTLRTIVVLRVIKI